MSRFLRTRGRAAATVLTTTVLLFGAAAGATASAQTPGAGLFGSATAGQTTSTGLGAGRFGGAGATGLPGIGLFKAVFAIFGAVHSQVPVIAAPIIAQAVIDKTITQAEADQLTVWLSGQHGMGASPMASAPTTKPSAGEISVLHKVIAAVIGQLATIAAPVIAQEVANGDLTQAEADMITKVLDGLAGALASGPAGPGSTTTMTSGLTGAAASGNLLTALESKLAAQVNKAAKKHHKHKKPATKVTRAHRSR